MVKFWHVNHVIIGQYDRFWSVGQLNWPEIEHNRDTTHSKHAISAHACAVPVFFVRAPFSLCVCAHVFELNVTVILTVKTIFYRKIRNRVGEVTSS